MDAIDTAISRDANGRFTPGQSGNPAGKLPGTRNRATILAEALRCGEAEDIARVVIDKAVAGDAAAARFCLGLLVPKPRGRAIRLPLPENVGAGGEVVGMFTAALHALAAGDITPDEAVQVSRFLEGRWRVLRAWQMERKVTGYSHRNPVPGDDWVPDEAAAPTEQLPVAPASRRPDAAAPDGDEESADSGREDAGGTPALRAAEPGGDGGRDQSRPDKMMGRRRTR